MDRREQILPLTLGALLAVTLHITFVAWSGQVLAVSSRSVVQATEPSRTIPEPPKPQPTAKPKPPVESQVQLGSDDGVEQLALAWISHDDFQALQACQARVVQPAVQEHVLPLEHAPIEPEPTPPKVPAIEPQPSEPASPGAPQPDDAVAVEQVEAHADTPAPAPSTKQVQSDAALDQAPANAAASLAGLPARQDRAMLPRLTAPDPNDLRPASQTEAPSPNPQPSAEPATAQTSKTKRVNPKATNQRDSKTLPKRAATLARPTAAPKDDKESDPFDLTASQRVVPGGVVVRKGIEIQTAKPKFGIATRVSALPSNPTVKVRFSRDGRVIKAWITHSSGYPSVDVPIVKSLYKWRAKGKQLAELGRSFEVEIKLILVTDEH